MKPILFNTEMVRAIQDGRKTVTRREPFQLPDGSILVGRCLDVKGRLCDLFRCGEELMPVPARYRPGDILYVRETWAPLLSGGYVYKASVECPAAWRGQFRPSIHMPKEAARIFLRVTGVRVERLQDIDDDGVVAEGLEIGAPFDELWDRTIKPADCPLYGWEADPWVWVIEFERVSRDEALKGGAP